MPPFPASPPPANKASRLSLGAGVGAGFIVLLVLMSTLIWVGLTRVNDLNSDIGNLVEVNHAKETLAYRMKNALRERALIMHSISVMMNQFDQDEEFLRFQELGADFTAARTELEFLADSDAETEILARMRELTVTTQPIVVEAVNLALKQRRVEARRLIDNQIIPLQKKLAHEIDSLVALQQEDARVSVQQARRLAGETRTLMLALGAFAFVVSLAVAAMVLRHARRQQRLLEHQALYDNLTELPNRRLFGDRLQQAILAAARDRRVFALLVIDLNRFKEVNDTLGHHAGDEVLRETARRVRHGLRASDTVARLGGDEMAVLLPNGSDVDTVSAMAERIQERLRQPYQLDGHSIEMGGSIGIALYPEHGMDAETLQRHADAAMYHAKRMQGGFVLYRPDLEPETGSTLALQAELRDGIARGQLILHYQPKIDLASGRVQGVEALVRWSHPRLGLLLPDRFLPLAESAGLMRPLTRAVVRLALLQSRLWRDEGIQLPVSVNVSPSCIRDVNFPEDIKALLQEAGAAGAWLEIELTEAAVVSSPERAIDCVRRLVDLGVQVSIDDFGTGYASVAKLSPQLLARIKIDKPYVSEVASNENTTRIVRSAIELGHSLGLKVVAEGVESEQVLERLREFGCDQVQGNVLSAPVPASKLVDWLRQLPAHSRSAPSLQVVATDNRAS